MTQNEKIIDRVKKLLRLATSDNINEAATSAALAQELIHKYNLSYLLLSDSYIDNDIRIMKDKDCLYKFNKNVISWKVIFASGLAELNHCRVYTSRIDGKRSGDAFIAIVGRESDIENLRPMYIYLVAEVERLCLRESKGKGKKWRNNFKLGAISTLYNSIKQSKEKAKKDFQNHCEQTNVSKASSSEALLKFDKKLKEVDDFIEENLNLKNPPKKDLSFDKQARLAGIQAATEINLGNKTIGDNQKLLNG